ncbi:MAG: YkgJ family cysteine cluster protein [Desulfotignum sp.]
MDAKYKTGDDIFVCQLCGQCCRGFGGTYVTDRDIMRISAYIQADPDTFVTSYCTMAGTRPVLSQGPDGYCVFFDKKKQCTIHPVKPCMCRKWPFLETLVANPENWDAMASACPGMRPLIPFSDLARIVAWERQKRNRPTGRTRQRHEAGPDMKPDPA